MNKKPQDMNVLAKFKVYSLFEDALRQGSGLRFMLLAALLALALPAAGQAVIMNGDYYLTHNEAGTAVNEAATTTFNPATCLWYFAQDNYIRPANSSGDAINVNNNYLQYTSLTLGSNGFNWYRARNNTNVQHRTGTFFTTNYYLRLNGTTWQINSTNSNNGRLYNATITTLGPTDNTTLPTISVASNTSNTITFSHSNLSGTYVPQYTRYVFNGGTHNWYNNTDYGNTAPSVNVNTLSPTYTWSLTANGGGMASIDPSTGVLTLSGAPTGNITVRLTVGNISPMANKTVDFTLTRAAISEKVTSTTTITGPTLTPASAALYYNEGSQTFTATASAATVTSTTPADTTLSGGGYTYYYYNGVLNNAAPSPNVVQTNSDVTLAWTLSGAAATNLSLSSATGASTTVTHTTQAPADRTATLTVTASAAGASNKQATATITAYGLMAAPTISRTGNSISLATASLGATIYYTTDGTTPSAGSTPYSGPFDLTTSPTTVKAIAIRDGRPSDVTTQVLKIQLAPPTISIGATGLATLTAEAGATIHYTTDGSTPTDGSPTYSGPVQLTNPQTIMAIAVRDGYDNSEVASDEYITGGISGGRVILDDREDHAWSYYCDASLPAQLRSLDPADVKITYYGNGNNVSTSNDAAPAANTFTASSNNSVKVGIDAPENTFVYFKTLERTTGSAYGSATYAYTAIPNPFSVRPTYSSGDTRWRGFYAWRVVSVSGGTISGKGVGDTINAESTVSLIPTAEYGMEVVLEALWARMYVNSGYQASVGYERNYVVGGAAVNYPATYSAIYPNGTTDGTATANSVPGTYNAGTRTLGYDTKFEYINLTGGTYTANNHYLCFGRGISTANNAGTVQGINAGTTNLNYTLRVESGTFNEFCFVRYNTNTTVSGRYLIKAIMGCDYDRATNTNNNLIVARNSNLFFAHRLQFSGSSNKDQKTFDCVFKSGTYQSDQWDEDQNGTNGYLHIAYLGQNSSQGNENYPGVRCVTVEGGDLGGMCGGRGVSNNSNNATYMTPEVITFDLRIKGGTFHGGVFGGAADNPSIGSRRFIMTGGEIWGWLAGGCNGTGSQTGSGATNGDSYIYVGGTALVGGNNAMCLQNTNGGQVFGAGRGLNDTRTSSVNHSHVAVADEAVVSNNNNNNNYAVGGNVYGGSYNGTVVTEANVYILGGRVEGGVYGGSYGNATDSPVPVANVTMTGGLVTNGVYGGSNSKGTVGTVTMHIDGGTVGDGTSEDGVYGGGYGADTRVNGNVSVTLGASTSATDSATVNGNVYGGSALGSVNTNNSNTTVVTMNKALVNGNLFGGAFGNGAQVRGYITVNILGGRVTNSVFGGGDAAAYGTAGWNYPVVNMSGGTVRNIFGGGKGSTARVTGNPQVTLSGKAHVTGNVYGGGDAAEVTGQTNVRLQD